MSKKQIKKVFRSYDEFMQHYFPKKYEEDRVKNLTPSELGKEMATKTIKEIFKKLIKLGES